MTLQSANRLHLALFAFCACAALLGYALTQGWLGRLEFVTPPFTLLLLLIGIPLAAATTTATIRATPIGQPTIPEFARRHWLALALMAVTIIILIVGITNDDRFFSTYSLPGFFWLIFQVQWLVNSRRFETDALLRENTARLWGEQRDIVILFTLVVTLSITAWATWTQPFASFQAFQAFSYLVYFALSPLAGLPNSLRAWPNRPRWRLMAFGFIALWLGYFALWVYLSSYMCQQADCGGWLLRSPQPVSWREQQQALREGATFDSSYKLTGVRANSAMYQPPHSARLVLEVRYEYTSDKGDLSYVSIQDSAPIWKRDVDLQAGQSYVLPPVDVAPLLAQTQIGPSDVLSLTYATALAAGARTDGFYGPQISLLSAADASSLSSNQAPVWKITYHLKAAPDQPYNLRFWVNGVTGEILKQATE